MICLRPWRGHWPRSTSHLDDPSLINADTYDEGWMIEIETSVTAALLTPDAYAEHLNQAWEVAQRTIKGQANL